MAKRLPLKSFRVKNFKAIRDSGVVEFTPLTVLIGDNGSGKSSLIEGMQTYQRIVMDGLDEAMQIWRGFENIVNPPFNTQDDADAIAASTEPIEFSIQWQHESQSIGLIMSVASDPSINEVFIDSEILALNNQNYMERDRNSLKSSVSDERFPIPIPSRFSIVAPVMLSLLNILGRSMVADGNTSSEGMSDRLYGSDWQFVALNPAAMGDPRPMQRSGEQIRLQTNGANIAEFLWDIRRIDEDTFGGIVEALQFVLPYAKSLMPVLTSELERAVYLQLSERDFRVPGWLLSQGTMRTLALLALFRHPEPPPLIVIEELENGLDPRTIQFIAEEIRNVVESGRSQVIVTTHSPYLLDLLPLWSIVLVERDEDKGPVFFRPDEQPELDSWLERFGPGQLYTMQGLRLGASP